MDYDYIENLVRNAKAGDIKAKEDLLKEFTPFINFMSRKTFIHGYELGDIKNECIVTLLNCITTYKLDSNRFVAYAANAIRNNLNVLIIRVTKSEYFDGFSSLNDTMEETVSINSMSAEDSLRLEYEHILLASAIKNNLDESEKHLISFIFFKKNTLTNYAYYENISYVTASKRKKKVLEKLKNYITGGNELWELMI